MEHISFRIDGPMKLRFVLALALASAALVGACAVAPGLETAAPTMAELRRVRYDAGDAPGVATPVDDFRVVGDLDGDGIDEAVVLLVHSAGGSGSWTSLAVVKRLGGRPFHVASAALGDRAQLRAARIADGRLLASGVRAGRGDPACCPGELVEWTWVLRDLRLEPVDIRIAGRLTLEALAAGPWLLHAWDAGEAAPALPAVTLSYAAGHISGRAGCNRYTVAASDGDLPGALSVGPIAATRMACPDAETAVETRFLQQLAAARRYGFQAGRLAILTAGADGKPRTLLFEAEARAASR